MKITFMLLGLTLSLSSFAQKIYKENFPGGVYIVNGDEAYESLSLIPLPAEANFKSTDLIINTIENGLFDKWSKKDSSNLTYCISNDFGADKDKVINAMEEATGDWMGVANVKYTYMPQHDSRCNEKNTSVMFDVRPVFGQPYLARAFFPNSKRPGRNILIDSSSMKYDDTAFSGFLRHELGHTLGFRHEHISKDSKGLCPEDSKFDPLTSYDPYSVMHYPQCGGKNVLTNMTLSKLDEAGAAKVYPF